MTDNKNNKNLDDNSYEEISEKKTSKLGYIFLIIMAVFIIVIGQKVYSDLTRIPERPIMPSRCVKINTNSTYASSCYFNSIDKKFGLDSMYSSISYEVKQLKSLNGSISNYKSDITNYNRQIETLNDQYDLSLQEKIAQEEVVTDRKQIQNQILQLENNKKNTEREIAKLELERNSISKKIEPAITSLNITYDKAVDYYQVQESYYDLKVFLLKLLFILPLFLISIFAYLKLKRKNSPYTIILTAILTSASILFLQVIVVFLYEILPMEWFAKIFKILLEVPFLRYIIYYGSVVLVILIFGGVVYYIQKKVFDPNKVAIRHLKDNKCPGCSFSINPDHIFCPKCGQQLKDKCSNCGNLRVHYLPYCPYCKSK